MRRAVLLLAAAAVWAQAPSPVSVSPASGSGSPQTFQFVFSDPNGYADIQWTQMLMNSTLNGANACYMYYWRPSNVIYLSTDAGGGNWVGSAALGSPGTLENSQCILNLQASSYSNSGNNLTVNVALTFKSAFAGARNWYGVVGDAGGLQSNWVTLGSWTVPAGNQAPSPVSVSPSSGSGYMQAFQFVFTDPNGYADIQWTQMLMNSTLDAANACYLYYWRPTNVIYLSTDAGGGNWVGSGALGPTAQPPTLENSRCILNLQASSYSNSGINLTVNLSFTFKAAFVGARTWYGLVGDAGGLQSNWMQLGSWTVTAPPGGPTITTSSPLPPWTVGSPYSVTFQATGGAPPYSWSFAPGSSAPPGLNLSGAVLSGTPTTANTFNFTIRVTGGGTTDKTFSLIINPALNITTSSPLPSWTVGRPYSVAFTRSGGTSPFTWSLAPGSPALPPVLTISGAGVLDGTPSTAGGYSFAIRVSDGANTSYDKTFGLTLNPPVQIDTSATLPAGAPGVLYTQTLSASDGTPPYSWSQVGGSLPPGINLSSSGVLNGTPTTTGQYSFTARVTDSPGDTEDRIFYLTITSQLTITTSPTLPNGTAGVPYSGGFSAVGGNPPYTWSVVAGSLPVGLTLNFPDGRVDRYHCRSGNLCVYDSGDGQLLGHGDEAVHLDHGLSRIRARRPEDLPDSDHVLHLYAPDRNLHGFSGDLDQSLQRDRHRRGDPRANGFGPGSGIPREWSRFRLHDEDRRRNRANWYHDSEPHVLRKQQHEPGRIRDEPQLSCRCMPSGAHDADELRQHKERPQRPTKMR
jgi:hypothetical protein